jgi:hypothetical protein
VHDLPRRGILVRVFGRPHLVSVSDIALPARLQNVPSRSHVREPAVSRRLASRIRMVEARSPPMSNIIGEARGNAAVEDFIQMPARISRIMYIRSRKCHLVSMAFESRESRRLSVLLLQEVNTDADQIIHQQFLHAKPLNLGLRNVRLAFFGTIQIAEW